MYEKDGISKDDVVRIVDRFPNQGKYSVFHVLSELFTFLQLL